eukprot:10485306-Ditylum_brightwellii.AAC.1
MCQSSSVTPVKAVEASPTSPLKLCCTASVASSPLASLASFSSLDPSSLVLLELNSLCPSKEVVWDNADKDRRGAEMLHLLEAGDGIKARADKGCGAKGKTITAIGTHGLFLPCNNEEHESDRTNVSFSLSDDDSASCSASLLLICRDTVSFKEKTKSAALI